MAKILVPETETPATTGTLAMEVPVQGSNLLEATADGAAEGLRLALNVGAMLLAFIALLALVNYLLGIAGRPVLFGWQPYDLNAVIASWTDGRFTSLSMQSLFAFLFAPIAWIMGVPSNEILLFGSLLGEKIAVNEFIAYLSLGNLKDVLSDRTTIIAAYALCGFANFSSIAIQIGGIGGIAPERRGDVARLGMQSLLGGALASWMTATIAGMLIG